MIQFPHREELILIIRNKGCNPGRVCKDILDKKITSCRNCSLFPHYNAYNKALDTFIKRYGEEELEKDLFEVLL